MKERIFKKLFIITGIVNILIIIRICIFGYYEIYEAANPINIKHSFDNDILKITFDLTSKNNGNMYCLIKKKDEQFPSPTDEKWFQAKNNECKFKLEDDIYKIYLKNNDDKIFYVDGSDTFGNILNIKYNNSTLYVALNGKYKANLSIDSVGYIDKTINWKSNDETIAKINNDGTVYGNKKGKTKIIASIMDKSLSIDVMVTNLIITRPQKYNNSKKYLPCGAFSKEENDILDDILKSRINDVGYQTRAGAVEAARFLALEFPYKIRYFSENGRLTTNGVDGEGRYYHKGLYLDESRFENISKSKNGPKTWGCTMYSGPSHGNRSNGLDCSGFISWVLYNGGFDVKDVGAGLASYLDLTDYGERTKFNYDIVKSGKVKVGDLLSSGGPNGGHIAIIVGEDNDYYYVAESLWVPPNVAVVIIGYSKKTIFNRYYYVMFMDSYYKKDGNLTKLWY